MDILKSFSKSFSESGVKALDSKFLIKQGDSEQTQRNKKIGRSVSSGLLFIASLVEMVALNALIIGAMIALGLTLIGGAILMQLEVPERLGERIISNARAIGNSARGIFNMRPMGASEIGESTKLQQIQVVPIK